MILPVTSVKTRTKYGSIPTRCRPQKGYEDVWSYIQGSMLRLGCSTGDQYIFESESQAEQVPPFACSFSRMSNSSHLLAVVDEDGFVTLFDTRHTAEVVKVFRAHKNAVFDVAWAEGKNQLVTASGDQMAVLWDVVAGQALGVFMGHSCSLKSVCFQPGDCHVFATGARDGNILVWDTRCNNRGGSQVPHHTAVNIIKEAHAEASTLRNTPTRKRRSRLIPSMPMRGDNLSSVTVVNFQDDVSLFSAGATDRTIKVWDLRKCNKGMKKAPTPRHIYPYTGTSVKNGGFSSLVFNSTRSEFFASCTDDVIYRYSTLGSQKQPIATYSGHRNSSFYVKSALSRDDGLLLSGSGNGKAYIWNVDRPESAPITLCGHEEEVTMVAWAEDDFPKVVTGADDSSIRIWRMQKHDDAIGRQSQKELIGHAERSECRNQMKENLAPAVGNTVQPTGHATPPRLNRIKSDGQDARKVPASSSPATPKSQSTRSSSISDWLRHSPKTESKEGKDSNSANAKVSRPVSSDKVHQSPIETQDGRPSVLGPCAKQNASYIAQGPTGTHHAQQIKTSLNPIQVASQELDRNASSGNRGGACVQKGDSHSGEKVILPENVGIEDAPKSRNFPNEDSKQFNAKTALQFDRSADNSSLPSTTSINSNKNKKPNEQSLVHELQPTTTSAQTLKPASTLSDKTDSLSGDTPLALRKRKRRESMEKVPTVGETSTDKEENQSCQDLSHSDGDTPRPVKRSKSLDADSPKIRVSRGIGRARGSLSSHAQHQLCTCSCSGNHRHPAGNSTAKMPGHARESPNDSQEDSYLHRDTGKTSCSGSTRNICYYFRPHTREVKRSLSDSAGTKNGPLPSAGTKNGPLPSAGTKNGPLPSAGTKNGPLPSARTKNGPLPSARTKNGPLHSARTKNGPLPKSVPKEFSQC